MPRFFKYSGSKRARTSWPLPDSMWTILPPKNGSDASTRIRALPSLVTPTILPTMLTALPALAPRFLPKRIPALTLRPISTQRPKRSRHWSITSMERSAEVNSPSAVRGSRCSKSKLLSLFKRVYATQTISKFFNCGDRTTRS